MPAAAGSGDCSSWADACSLQTALANSGSGDEIWVAAGTYTPTLDADRTVSFVLKSGVAVYGGFSGSETDRSQRDIVANLTILSGDINSNDTNNPATSTGDIVGANSYHVVRASGSDSSAILDGFTISAGSTDDSIYPNNVGGGMFNGWWDDGAGGIDAGTPSLNGVVFSGNWASSGGSIFNGSSPTFTATTFNGNTANTTGGGMLNYGGSPTLSSVEFTSNTATHGGGMANGNSGNAVLNNVTFENNTATDGGAMYNYTDSSPNVTDTTFNNNTAIGNGAGIYNNASSSFNLKNVTFNGNHAAADGGGVYISDSWNYLTNVTFTENTATNGAGLFILDAGVDLYNATFVSNSASAAGGGIFTSSTYFSTYIYNSIVWENIAPSGAQIHKGTGSYLFIDYSDIQGGYTGTGNIDLDPLLGPLGDYGGSTRVIPILNGSPAIDTADNSHCPSSDQRGVVRPQNGTCDMGAVEWGFLHAVPGGLTSGACDTWANACDLQYAMTNTFPLSEIWVAGGTYKPTGEADRSATFQLKDNVAVYGGFAGNETVRSQRNPVIYISYLSGDIGILDSIGDNSYHVVTASGTDASAILDGFMIVSGNAKTARTPTNSGGGMLVLSGSPSLTDIIFSTNFADNGAGMYNGANSQPALTDITFTHNTASATGGGMYNRCQRSFRDQRNDPRQLRRGWRRNDQRGLQPDTHQCYHHGQFRLWHRRWFV